MEAITKYKAIDGKEFNSESACIEYEKLIDKVEQIISRLGKKPELPGFRFENGDGYLQHTKELVLSVRDALLKLAKTRIDHKWINDSIEKPEDTHISWVARLVSEYYELSPISGAIYRLQCMDKQYREWGQPYYAEHPDHAKQVCLN